MHEDAVRFLSQPVKAQPASPLRVVVYSRIAEAIRNNLQPGSMLPTDTELGTSMLVSRTVVREALMLLEEDGLIRAKRGVGRFVSDALPRIGIIERIRPFEEVLGGPVQHLEVKRIQVEKQPASEFAAPGVGVEPGSDVWLWESVLSAAANPSRTSKKTSPHSPSVSPAVRPRRWKSTTTPAPPCLPPSTKRAAGSRAPASARSI